MDIVDRGKLYRFALPSGMYVEFSDKEAADWVDGMQKEVERLRAEVAALKSELKEISIALNDPADNLIRTTAECVSELRKDAKRYLWLRDSAPEKWAPWADEREDTTPKEIDAAIDTALGGEGKDG